MDSNKNNKLLVDIYLAKNLGDDMFLDHLANTVPTINFVPFYPGKRYNQFYSNYSNISPFPYTFIDKIRARLGFNKLSNYEILAKEYDGLLFLGGGIFREESYWKELYTYRLKISEGFKKRDKGVFFVGCSFGPYTTTIFVKQHRLLFDNADHVSFRDQKSFNLFSSNPFISYAPDLLWSYNLPKVKTLKDVIGISVIDPRHKEKYKQNYQDYIQKHKNICQQFLDNGKTVRLFSFCETEGDLTIAREIAAAFKNIEIYNYTGNIEAYLVKIGECEQFIAARFHAVIIALKYGIEVLPIIYGDKTENLLKDLRYTQPYIYLDNLEEIENAAYLSIDEQAINELSTASKKHLKFLL